MLTRQGSAFLFSFKGIGVFLHWSWAIALLWRVWAAGDARGWVSGETHSIPYHLLWVVTIFAIVLVHEFGHALACKSVGGIANTIVLWPLGGVAYVQPPERPGAMLWSIVAGPLVNVALVPVTLLAVFATQYLPVPVVFADFAVDIAIANGVLLAFNMLPFYPLDGGQILRSLIWYVAGRGMSLAIAGGVGLAGAAALGLLGVYAGGIWMMLVAMFMGLQSMAALRMGMALHHMDRMPPNVRWQV